MRNAFSTLIVAVCVAGCSAQSAPPPSTDQPAVGTTRDNTSPADSVDKAQTARAPGPSAEAIEGGSAKSNAPGYSDGTDSAAAGKSNDVATQTNGEVSDAAGSEEPSAGPGDKGKRRAGGGKLLRGLGRAFTEALGKTLGGKDDQMPDEPALEPDAPFDTDEPIVADPDGGSTTNEPDSDDEGPEPADDEDAGQN